VIIPALCQEMIAQIPTSEFPPQALMAMNTAAQVDGAKIEALFPLPKVQQIIHWVRLFTPNVFAAFFEMSREVVDAR